MTMNPRSIVLDPFFDGEADLDAGAYAPAPQQNQRGRVNGYQDAHTAQLSNGQSMGSAMRRSQEGLRGVVIPRATMGGIPQGTNPHATRDIEVNIDPHIEGQNSRVRLGDVSVASVQAATQMAQQVTPEPYSVETQRLRGAAIMHGISAQAQMAPPMQSIQHAPMQQAPAPQQRSAPQPRRTLRPVTTLAPPQDAQYNGRELRNIDLPEEPRHVMPPQQPQATVPNIEVTFEIEHFGMHTANYHDVIIEPNFIVLIYDNRCRGGGRYFPQVSGENQPPMALSVTGTNEAYLVHVTGVQYAYRDIEHCVLMVERSWTLEPQQP